MNPSLAKKLQNLTNNPGIYQFKNVLGKIIYVGKAKNLKNRVGSYFHLGPDAGPKTESLVARINDVETIQVESELDALILEAELIKKYKPKYNIVLKDDKTFLFIVIRNELSAPRILTLHKNDLMPKDVFFGPYPDGSTARSVVRTLRKVFPFRDCSSSKFRTYQNKKRVCLFGELGLCSGPCVNNSVAEMVAYNKNIINIKKILRGGSSNVLNELNKKMATLAKAHQFEKAANIRDLISKFDYVRQKYKAPIKYIESPTLVEDLYESALQELIKQIPILTTMPTRIECYDISNISGKEAVGSMVVAEGGQITKKEYRKFKIKFKQTPDDFDMLYEVLSRRLEHHPSVAPKKSTWPVPDLLLIDGGKGQVSAVFEAVKNVGLDIPIVGLAKKFETLVFKLDNEFVELKINKNNPGLKLLINLRDEAHRFAQSYHHKLRSKLYNLSK